MSVYTYRNESYHYKTWIFSWSLNTFWASLICLYGAANLLTLCILETPKGGLWQQVITQKKCNIYYAAFHLGLHCLLLKIKTTFRDINITSRFRKFYLWPLNVHNGQSHTVVSICMGKFIIIQSILFDLILYMYVPVNNFSVMSGRVFLGWTSTKQGLMFLAQGHNAETLVRLKPTALRSPVKHSTTEMLRSNNTKSEIYILIYQAVLLLGQRLQDFQML